MILEPLNSHYAVELVEVEAVSAGGIALMSNEVGAKKTQGTVFAIPEDNPLKLSIGDTVVVAERGGHQDVTAGGKSVSIIASDNIIAKLTK